MAGPTTVPSLVDRHEAIRRALGGRDPVLIERGIAAFQRERTLLLEQGKDGHMVAYHGERQVASARDYKRLHRRLRSLGHSDEANLFIACVSSQDID